MHVARRDLVDRKTRCALLRTKLSRTYRDTPAPFRNARKLTRADTSFLARGSERKLSSALAHVPCHILMAGRPTEFDRTDYRRER